MTLTKKQQTKSKIWSMKKADDEFSLWIRRRDKFTCKRCGKVYKEGERGLTNSHFWPRQHKGTRYDPRNNDAVCWMPCHKYYWEKEKQGPYMDYMLKKLGKKEYEVVKKLAQGTTPLTTAIIACMQLVPHVVPHGK